MVAIGNFFGSILGYLLWFFYRFIGNYGIAIVLFTIVLKIFMFPFSIKQQKSMAATGKMSAKQRELQQKYGNDKMKLNEELQKLYEKEGYNPASGCLPALIPFPIMIGLYYTVINPLSNAIHLGKEAVAQAVGILQQVPGISATFQGYYGEMAIVRHISELRPYLTMFSDKDLSKIEWLGRGFDFLGLNLLGTPSVAGGNMFTTVFSIFHSNLWVIPVLCLVSSLITQVISMRMQPGMQQQQGCMKGMLFAMPLVSAGFALSVPAAVGFYWIISNLTALIQIVIMNVFFSPAYLTAKAEAQRIALREQEEAKAKPLPAPVQQKILEKNTRTAPKNAGQKSPAESRQGKRPGKQKGGKAGGSSGYLGTKK